MISFQDVDVCSHLGSFGSSDLCKGLFEFRGVGMLFHKEYNWLLSPFFLYVMPAMYLVGSVCLFFVVEGLDLRISKRLLKICMSLYNITQILLCGYMVVGLTPLLEFPNIFGIHRPENPIIEWYTLIHFLSKFLDFFDTFFMIVNRRSYAQLSWLHLFHHSTIGAIWGGWLLANGVGGGLIMWGNYANSLTHCIMYSHFMWTGFGFRNPFKKWVTRWQIFQFYTCWLHALLAIVMNDYRAYYAAMQLFYQSIMIYLFTYKLNWMPWFVTKYAMNPNNIKKS